MSRGEIPIGSAEETDWAADILRDKGVGTALIKLRDGGSVLVGAGARELLRGPEVKPVDKAGAGDAFAGPRLVRDPAPETDDPESGPSGCAGFRFLRHPVRFASLLSHRLGLGSLNEIDSGHSGILSPGITKTPGPSPIQLAGVLPPLEGPFPATIPLRGEGRGWPNLRPGPHLS
jgi:hypothetical protein